VSDTDEMDDPTAEPIDLTSLHLWRARKGEQASLSWVVAHFTPFLQAQAQYRIQGGMRRLYDPDDIVDEVWMVALPRIADLNAREGHWTPVVLKFLATTLLNRVSNHLTRYLRNEARGPDSSSPSFGTLSSPATSVVGSAARNEARGLLDEALQGLEPHERELLVLRGIEQQANKDVARRLGVEPSTVTRRYQAILGKLQARLPGSIFDQLPT